MPECRGDQAHAVDVLIDENSFLQKFIHQLLERTVQQDSPAFMH
jgi:hypothetical protein